MEQALVTIGLDNISVSFIQLTQQSQNFTYFNTIDFALLNQL